MPLPTPVCSDEARRAMVAASVALNGIDYLEVSRDQRTLRVAMLHPMPAAAYGLPGDPSRISVEGGVRIKNIRVTDVRRATDTVLEVDVDQPGDFSPYILVIGSAAFDPAYDRVRFGFKSGCPNRFDCKPRHDCPPEAFDEPVIDYMAKDYASFRRALLDFITVRKPDWRERNEADVGIAILETLAYAGDHLSYYQDAVANEPYLATARQRTSVRRHARLVDYRMHDGASARTWIHFGLVGGASGSLDAGARILTKLDVRLGPLFPPFPAELPVVIADDAEAAAQAVFETLHRVTLSDLLNRVGIHAWGNRACCLPRGVTSVELLTDLTPVLSVGAYLLFEELKGPKTGLAADADRSHRQVVRLTSVETTVDPLLGTVLTRVAWDAADALRFPMCLSVLLPDGTYVDDVSIARGNIALADHGRIRGDDYPGVPGLGTRGISVGLRSFRFALEHGPLSQRVALDPKRPASAAESIDPSTATPEVRAMAIRVPPMPPETDWLPTPDLLAGGPFDHRFQVETDNQGVASLRFGDNVYGQAPQEGSYIHVTYRTGVGTAGNIGSDALAHVTNPSTPGLVALVRNPLPAWGGADPEPIERVKQLAPAAFHAEQFRAVTEDDYAKAAEKHPAVSHAVGRFRWTGSWLTVFINIDPLGTDVLTFELARSVRDWVTRYTLAGYDLEIVPPVYVPLDLVLDVCVKRDHFRADVERVLGDVLSSASFPGGTTGFFHPDRFTFGQELYLSALYTAVLDVEGIDSVLASRFRRQDEYDPEPSRPATRVNLDRGSIRIAALEIARLANDPNFPEHGTLRLNLMGGK